MMLSYCLCAVADDQLMSQVAVVDNEPAVLVALLVVDAFVVVDPKLLEGDELPDVVNNKEDLVVFPRFVGNIGLRTNGGKMSLKMSSWKGFGESIGWVVFCWDRMKNKLTSLMQILNPQKAKLNMLVRLLIPIR